MIETLDQNGWKREGKSWTRNVYDRLASKARVKKELNG